MTEFPGMEDAAVAALQDLDAKLADGESCVPQPSKAPRVIIDILCNGQRLRTLADLGSEVNISADTLVEKLRLRRRQLVKPTQLGLALVADKPPEVLTHFTVANLTNPITTREFDRTYFELGNLGKEYDMILGTNCFNIFQFSMSIIQRAIICEKSVMNTFIHKSWKNCPVGCRSRPHHVYSSPMLHLRQTGRRRCKQPLASSR